jgi:ribonuclease D
MTIFLYQNDLPSDLPFGSSVAIDTETMGLNLVRDRLCLIQLSFGDGHAHLVQFPVGSDYAAPNLRRLLNDQKIEKLFHFARFDLASIEAYMGVTCTPVYCTKTASRLVRTFTDRHSLKELCRELLGVELNKQQQSSDWGAPVLSEDQKTYAASDVLYLHKLKEKLDEILLREGRMELARACFDFLPYRAKLDLVGWPEIDIFAHNS